MGRLARLPLTSFDRTGVVRHQSLALDHLAYCDLVNDRQKRGNDVVRAHHALTVSRVNRRNSALDDALRPAPNFAVGGWAWVNNSASTNRHGEKANCDANVLKANSRLIGHACTRSWTSVPVPPPRPQTARRSAEISSIWISFPTCPVRTLVGVRPSSDANSVPTLTTAEIYRRG